MDGSQRRASAHATGACRQTTKSSSKVALATKVPNVFLWEVLGEAATAQVEAIDGVGAWREINSLNLANNMKISFIKVMDCLIAPSVTIKT